MVIGITGSISTGKSFVSEYLKNLGYDVIDADEISKNALIKDSYCYIKVLESFSDDILDINKNIDRKKLGKIIFYDRKMRKVLEDIIHPFVIEKIKLKINSFPEDKILFVSMPLLYEVGFEKYLDATLVVACDEKVQIERLMQRDSIDASYAKTKIATQMPQNKKISLADYVIDNSLGKEKTIDNIKKVILQIENSIQKRKELNY